MTILSWNCRGLKTLDSKVISFISNIARISNVDFIFLSETKSQVSSLEPIFIRLGFQGCMGVGTINNSGGLFLCWTKCVVVTFLSTSKM